MSSVRDCYLMLVNAPVSYLYIPDIPRIEFQKKQSVFSLTVLMLDTRSFLSSDKADLPTNLKIKHVLQSLYYSTTMFSPFCLYFVGVPRTVTRAVIGSSTPRFQSVNTFQARKENNRSFTH